MAPKVVIEKTGIYERQTKTFSSAEDVPELTKAVEAMGRGWDLDCILQDAVEEALRRLRLCGVEELDHQRTLDEFGKSNNVSLAGNHCLRIPPERPDQIRPRNAALSSSPQDLDLWWSVEIRRARDVLFQVHVLRDWLKKGDVRQIAVHAIVLGRKIERLCVTAFEPLSRIGGKQRKAGGDSWKESREFRCARTADIHTAVAKRKAAGDPNKVIASDIFDDPKLNRSNERLRVRPLKYSSMLKYTQEAEPQKT
jgi:hypothetical protein